MHIYSAEPNEQMCLLIKIVYITITSSYITITNGSIMSRNYMQKKTPITFINLSGCFLAWIGLYEQINGFIMTYPYMHTYIRDITSLWICN